MIKVSRSSYYKPRRNNRKSEEKSVQEAVIHCFEQNKGNYGRIRIRKALLKQGTEISEYIIAKVLKNNGLKAKSGRKKTYRKTKPAAEVYLEENLLKDEFTIQTPNKLWCSDITELKCRNRKIYVCGIIDAATRRITGWSISKTQTQDIVQNAFKMALGRNRKRIPEGAIYHSDRGSQYTAKKTKELVESNGFLKSMSRPGTPHDNQPIESFWNTLEREMPDISKMRYDEAKRTITSYIELYYNSERMHSGINYQIPNEFFTILSVY